RSRRVLLMSLAELFYAKHPRRLFPWRKRRPAPRRSRKALFESLENRLLLSVTPTVDPVLFIPGFGGTSAADQSDEGMKEWLTTRGLAPDKLQLENLASSGDDLVQTLQNAGYSLNAADPAKAGV